MPINNICTTKVLNPSHHQTKHSIKPRIKLAMARPLWIANKASPSPRPTCLQPPPHGEAAEQRVPTSVPRATCGASYGKGRHVRPPRACAYQRDHPFAHHTPVPISLLPVRRQQDQQCRVCRGTFRPLLSRSRCCAGSIDCIAALLLRARNHTTLECRSRQKRMRVTAKQVHAQCTMAL